eukprot:6191046-Pleurochrysis_carterae.AAC.2
MGEALAKLEADRCLFTISAVGEKESRARERACMGGKGCAWEEKGGGREGRGRRAEREGKKEVPCERGGLRKRWIEGSRMREWGIGEGDERRDVGTERRAQRG